MNLEKKFNIIAGNLNEPSNLSDLNCYTVLDISEPLMFVLNQLDEYNLAYVMQNKTMFLKGKKADVTEVLFSETNYDEIIQLLKGEKSIRNTFIGKECVNRVGRIGKKVFSPKHVSNIDEIDAKIPRENVYLNGEIPNRANLKEMIFQIESIQKKYSPYCLANQVVKKEEKYNMSNNSAEVFLKRADYDLQIIDDRVGNQKWK